MMTPPEPNSSLPPASTPEDILDCAIDEIVGKNNPYAYSVLITIERSLQQFHLSSRVEAYEILNEAYLRGIEFIGSGGIIKNPHAWLKGTSLNIVREKCRQLRAQPTDPQIIEFLKEVKEESLVSQLALESDLETLWKAIEILAKEDPQGIILLYLRTIEGLSWQEIRFRLLQKNKNVPKEVTLRQRLSRAKKRLRRIFHEVTLQV